MTDKVTVSILLDPEVYKQIRQLQKDKDVFSRSELIRQIIDAGLKKIK
jgi:metal-responsive CopG/Arc/MetJ family transcriptional regulator